jgi:hypothetical protein
MMLEVPAPIPKEIKPLIEEANELLPIIVTSIKTERKIELSINKTII